MSTYGSPQPAAVEKPNSFQRIVGARLAPTQTFEGIAKRPDILVPLLVMLLVSAISAIALTQRLDFNALGREAVEMGASNSGTQIPPERLERAVRFSGAMMKMVAYASPVLQIVILLIVAGILLIGFRLMAGEGDFRQALSVTTYAWYPRLIKGVLATVVLLTRKAPTIWEMQNPLRSNPAFLFSPKTQPIQFALASSLDVFSIWSIVLMIIGFAAMSKLSRAKSSAIVIALWIVGILLSLIGPAMQAARMHS